MEVRGLFGQERDGGLECHTTAVLAVGGLKENHACDSTLFLLH